MATLREIKRRINSVKSTQQITKAMKMVSAAKLRRAQENILAARPYAYKIRSMIQHLLEKIENPDDPLLQARPVRRVLMVIVTADRGLCGAFNSNIIRHTVAHISAFKDKEVSLLCVGKKGYDFFRKRDFNLSGNFINFFNELKFNHALEIADYLKNEFLTHRTDQIQMIYNEFKSPVQQNIVVEDYLPLKVAPVEETSGLHSLVDYIYEPSQEAILSALLPRHLNVQMWRILLESYAAEQGARMTAMENATENANEMIHDLTLHYNRARQAAITKEISEIVGGAEALKGS